MFSGINATGNSTITGHVLQWEKQIRGILIGINARSATAEFALSECSLVAKSVNTFVVIHGRI